ncbi:MAG: hypothetical protein ACR2RE_25015, partial [Geminicoccaceae bacterium]
MRLWIRLLIIALTVKLALFWTAGAWAHVSEQGFVLLLPTEVYSTAGVAVVALTVLALFAIPGGAVQRLFRVRTFQGLDLDG